VRFGHSFCEIDMASDRLVEGIDYYVEQGMFVFTSHYLRERGYCCRSGCRHCPYGFGTPNDRVEGPLDESDSPIRSEDSFDDTASSG